ncbi:MAG TPA: hypothetical protein VNM87_01185, partial [Candidatus Udaeobacter sp.]|nr:hypothetical protein [Candidatus Udaeobacter sp.]
DWRGRPARGYDGSRIGILVEAPGCLVPPETRLHGQARSQPPGRRAATGPTNPDPWALAYF